MNHKQYTILSTRPVKDSIKKQAVANGMAVDEVSLITTTPIQDITTQQEVEQAGLQCATVVFTSMNAVDAVTNMLDGHQPNWQIYCLGYKTKELITDYFGEAAIIGTADSAASLAEVMIEAEEESVIFFCGDQRRDELPAKLQEQDIDVQEITVYETTALPQKISKAYDGILFFSPSAVACFFAMNKAVDTTVFFAIGTSTAAEIRKHCTNEIVTSHLPGKDELLQQAIEHFKQKAIIQ